MTAETKRQQFWGLALTIKADARLRRLLAQPGGVQTWNRLTKSLWDRRMLNPVWLADEEPPPLAMSFDFRGVALSRMKLDGIDLSHVELGPDLVGASLRRAAFGLCPGCDFHLADLTEADFTLADISGCSFDGANLTDARFHGATYDRSDPPRSLPQIDLCRPMDWSQPTGRPGGDHPPLPWIPLRASLQLLDIGALLGDGD